MELVTCFKFDKDGYFVKEVLCQKDESGILLAKNSTPVAPDQSLLGKNFLKWDGKQWLPEPKPTTAEECAALGDLDHHSQTERVHELRKLFDDLTSGSEKWRVEQDPETLAKRVVAIPEKTQEEKDEEQAELIRNQRDAKIAETDYLLTPDYPISSESLEAVKVYRQALRDVPQQEGFPWNVVWPEIPAVLKE